METIDIKYDLLAEYCRKYYIKKLSLFGSYLKNEQKNNSDIDFLVEFKKGHTPGFLSISRMENELSKLFDGKKVDLKTYYELSRYFRDEVLNMASTQYEE
ncbi:MAG: nucleotidyltransferase domain-containing protein [Ignavibacteria bacterium]|nr:nucleotidyltransferase domain-containing protein [Ignavibacteria bacterium]